MKRNRIVTDKHRAQKIVNGYVCGRCYDELELEQIDENSYEVICKNAKRGLCDGGARFISIASAIHRLQQDDENWELVRESYPKWGDVSNERA